METGTGPSEKFTCELNSISACESSVTDELAGLEVRANGVASSVLDRDFMSGNTGFTRSRTETAAGTGTLSGQSKDKLRLGGDEAERKYKTWLRVEIVALCVVILIVWGLLLLPVVFYNLPASTVVSDIQACMVYV